MKMINFQLVTPEKLVLSEELISLSCPTKLGQITILPGHIPLVATLIPGELHAKTKNDDFYLHISGGFVQIQKNNKVIVLADAAEHYFEIDSERANQAKIRAEKALKETKIYEKEYAKVAASLEKSLSRLNIVRKHARKRLPITGEGVFRE